MNTLEISTISILHTLSKLTQEELSILVLVSTGKTLAEIANIRSLTLSEAELHMNTLLKKFELGTQSELKNIINEFNLYEVIT